MIKTEIDGIEIISNRDKEEHEELCSIINKYIDEIFKNVPREEIVKWIKKFDFTQKCIDNKKFIGGNYDSENSLITILDEDRLYTKIAIYHEITHARIYYENRDTYTELIQLGDCWSQINEYKTIVLTYSYFIDNCFISKPKYLFKSIIELVIYDLNIRIENMYRLYCFEKAGDMAIEKISEEKELSKEDYKKINSILVKQFDKYILNKMNMPWYEIAGMCACLQVIEKYERYILLFKINIEQKEIYSELKKIPDINLLLKINNFKYEISQEEINCLIKP